MRRRLIAMVAGCSLAAAGVFACGDDDSAAPNTTPDASTPETSVPDTAVDTFRPDTSTPVTDAGDGGVVPKVLVNFNATVGENPDGIAMLSSGLVVSLARNGKIVSILPDGGTSEYSTFGFTGVNQTGAPNSVWALGIMNDPAGNLYAAISTQGPPQSAGPPPVWTPEPGVYKIPPGGGTPVLFAKHVAMKNPKALIFVGTDLFISDTSGKIFRATDTGATTIWSADPELQGDLAACPVPIPVVVGAAGLAADATNLYVVNIQKGSLLKIPFVADGGADAGAAGTPVVIKKDCPTLGGADGLLLDSDGTFLVGVGVKNTVQRVTAAGVVTTVLTGKPLDGNTKMLIDTSGGKKRLLIVNPAFGTSAANPAAARPSLVSYDLP